MVSENWGGGGGGGYLIGGLIVRASYYLGFFWGSCIFVTHMTSAARYKHYSGGGVCRDHVDRQFPRLLHHAAS